jgi:hypothetical protein
MTPERTAKLVMRWVRFYTRRLPTAVAERRIEELEADLHDQIAHERDRAVSDRLIALAVLSRMFRGLAADASWRRQFRPPKGNPLKPLLALLAVAIGLAAMVLGEADDSPGLQGLGMLLIIGTVAFGIRTARRSS